MTALPEPDRPRRDDRRSPAAGAYYARLRDLVRQMRRAGCKSKLAIARTRGCSVEFVRRCLAPKVQQPTPPERRRERRHPSRYRYVRHMGWIGTDRYQVRLHVRTPLLGTLSIHLGCFGSEWEAGRAARAAIKAMPLGTLDPLRCWMAPPIETPLRSVELPPTRLLPPGPTDSRTGPARLSSAA